MEDKNFISNILLKPLNFFIQYKILFSVVIPLCYFIFFGIFFGRIDFFDFLFKDVTLLILITAFSILIILLSIGIYSSFCAMLIGGISVPKYESNILYSRKGIASIPAVSLGVNLLFYQTIFLEKEFGVLSSYFSVFLLIYMSMTIVSYISLKGTLKNCEAWICYTKRKKIEDKKPLKWGSVVISTKASLFLLFTLIIMHDYNNSWSWSVYITFIFLIICLHMPAAAIFALQARKQTKKESVKSFFFSVMVSIIIIIYIFPSLIAKVIPIAINFSGRGDWQVIEYTIDNNKLPENYRNPAYWGTSDISTRGDTIKVKAVMLLKANDHVILCPQKIKESLDKAFEIGFIWQDTSEKIEASKKVKEIVAGCPSLKYDNLQRSVNI